MGICRTQKVACVVVMAVLVGVLLAGPAAAFDPGELGSLGGMVWFDVYATQTFTPEQGDYPIPDATASLSVWRYFRGVWQWLPVGTQTTGADGKYLFTGLSPGQYRVVVSGSPLDGLYPTWDYDEPYGEGVRTPHVALVELVQTNGAANVRGVDFGYTRLGSLGDRVWYDTNADGVQDEGEPGIESCTVTITGAFGYEEVTTTDANGIYWFHDLYPGTYRVTVSQGAGEPIENLVPTYDLDGIDTPHTSLASVPIIVDGAPVFVNDLVDFGYVEEQVQPELCALGDLVWYDANSNGVQDPGEPGIAGVTLTLTGDVNGDGEIDTLTTVTDSNGNYWFRELWPGTYTVAVTAGLPEGYMPTYDYDGINTPNVAIVTLAEGEENWLVDFGYVEMPPDGYATYTQGGWSSPPRGENPGKLLHDNFSNIYGANGLVVGGWYTLTFTTAQQITNFLPQGGTPGVLGQSYAPPMGSTEAGVFAGQVVAFRLNVDFSDAGITQSGLAGLKIAKGPYEGWTVGALLDYAEEVLGGDSSILITSLSVLNDTVTAINENYCDGADNGFLKR